MKKYLIVAVVIFTMALTACGNKGAENTGSAVAEETQAVKQEETKEAIKIDTSADNSSFQTQPETVKETMTENPELSKDLTFEDLSKSVFEFSSGAGAWMTTMNIEKDGSFIGEYHDSDMGDQAESYKNGTYYLSRFSGQFSGLEKVDNHTYRLKIDKLKYRYQTGTEEFMNDVRYVYSTAYGLDKGENFYIHCPGKAMSELTEGVHSWIDMAAQNKETLEFYVLENKEQEQAFYSYPRLSASEEAAQILGYAEATYNSIKNDLTTKDMPQVDLEFTAKLLDDEADYSLNRLWNLVRNNTDEATYNKLLEEQRSWIKTRDKTVDEKTQQYKGGSIYGMQFYMERANLSIERCRELAAVLTH